MKYAFAMIVFMAGVLAVGCNVKEKETPPVEPIAAPQANLLDIRWELTELNGQPVASIAPGKSADITFLSKDGRVAGMASVNRFFGTFTAAGNALTIKPAGMTRMAGPEPLMKQEQDYTKALEAVKTYRITGDSLELLDGTTVVAKFAKR